MVVFFSNVEVNMYGYAYILLPCVVILVLVFFLIVKKNKRGSTREGFRSRYQTMDTVLDSWCDTEYKFGPNYNDYIHGNNWKTNTDEESTAICGRYDCPLETCKVFTSNTIFGRTEYFYQTRVSNQVRDTTDQTCITAHNPSSNVYCEPDGQPPQCVKDTHNTKCFTFDSNKKKWTEIYFNNYMSSNGSDCVYQQTEYPYSSIYYSNQAYQLGSPDAPVKCFHEDDTTSCQITYDGFNNKYSDSLGADVSQPDYTSEFVPSRNAFVCDNGNKLRYGYVSNNRTGVVDGMTCGFLDPDCSNCPITKETCYVFDSNTREYNENVFMNVYWEHGGSKEDYCDSFRVNQSRDEVDNFENVDWKDFASDVSHANTIYNGMFLRNQNDRTSYTTFESYNNVCCNLVDPNQCSADKKTIAFTKINNISDTSTKESLEYKISRNELNLVDINGNDVPVGNQFHDLTYNRQWNSNGTGCEYCLIDTFSGSPDSGSPDIIGSCFSNIPTDEDTLSCDKGQELVQNELKTYCRYCSSNEYYDETTSNCKPLLGCISGKRFAPFSNNEHIYPSEFSDTDTTPFDVSRNYFTSNTTVSQCIPCESNTYIDDTVHRNRSCKECPISKGRYTEEVYTVNEAKNECSICGGNVKKNRQNSMGYIVVDSSPTDNTPSCSNCLHLGNNDDDVKAGVAKIVGLTRFNLDDQRTTSSCIKKCGGPGSRRNIGNKQILPNRDIEYKDGTFSNCPFACPQGFFQNDSSCTLCPKGTQLNKNNQCEPCANGFYNNISGGICKSCPNTMGALRHKPIITEYDDGAGNMSNIGASNISHCKVECLDKDDDDSNVYVEFTTANSVDDYNFDDCPSTPCVAGFEKTNLDNNMGYTLSNVYGEQNRSKGETSQFSCPHEDKANLEQSDSCVSDSSGASYREETYTEGTTCCKGNLNNTGYGECACPNNGNLNDPLAKSNMEWNGSYCVKQCKDNPANGTIVLGLSGKCELKCNSGTYPTDDNQCEACPHGSNMSEPRFLSGGTGIESCYTNNCTEGYTKPYGISQWSATNSNYSPRCIERQIQCQTLKPVAKESFNSYTYTLKQDDSNLRVKELVYSNVGYNLLINGVCPEVGANGNKFGSYYVTCEPGNLNLSPIPVVDLETGERTRSRDNLLFCCDNQTTHMIGVYDGVYVSGCCAPNQLLTASGSCMNKCSNAPNQSYTVTENGECLYTCDPGYIDVPDEPGSESAT